MIKSSKLLNLIYAIVFSITGTLFLIGGSVQAKSINTAVSPPNTIVTQETLQLPAKFCAALKVSFPAQAKNPNLCLVVHKTTMTEVKNKKAIGVIPNDNWWQCFSGTRSYQDDMYGLFWDYDSHLATSWSWSGACGVPPTLTRETCTWNWGFPWVESSKSCDSYTTNIPSRAALYTSYITEANGLAGGATIWQRRECFTGEENGDSNDGTCNWAHYNELP